MLIKQPTQCITKVDTSTASDDQQAATIIVALYALLCLFKDSIEKIKDFFEHKHIS